MEPTRSNAKYKKIKKKTGGLQKEHGKGKKQHPFKSNKQRGETLTAGEGRQNRGKVVSRVNKLDDGGVPLYLEKKIGVVFKKRGEGDWMEKLKRSNGGRILLRGSTTCKSLREIPSKKELTRRRRGNWWNKVKTNPNIDISKKEGCDLGQKGGWEVRL